MVVATEEDGRDGMMTINSTEGRERERKGELERVRREGGGGGGGERPKIETALEGGKDGGCLSKKSPSKEYSVAYTSVRISYVQLYIFQY